MKAVLVARVSTEDQLDALPAQKYRLQDYAITKGYDYELIEIQESAYKGERDKFKLVIDKLKTFTEPVILVFDKVDRYSRDVSSALVKELETMRKAGKIELHFPSDNLYLDKNAPAVNNMQLNMSLAFSQYYSDSVSDNVKRRLEQKWRDGEWAGKAPIGYGNIDLDKNQKWIEPDPIDSKIVIAMFEWYCTSVESVRTIKVKLEAEYGLIKGVSQVARILSNPFYYGQMEVKGKLYAHKYEKLVSEHIFDTAKQVREGFTLQRYKWGGLPYKYRSLIDCADCGCQITFEMKKKKYLYGHCTQYKGKHNAAYVPEEELTNQFASVFESISISELDYQEASQKINEEQEAIQKGRDLELSKLHAERANYTRRIERIYNDLLSDKISEELYEKKRVEFEKKKENIDRQVRAFELSDNSQFGNISHLLELARDASELFKNGNLEEKRQLIKMTLSNLQLKNRLLRWKLKKPFELMAFCAENRDWQGRQDLNLRHLVLETSALPTELRPYNVDNG